jgi:thioredoxin reductase
MYDIAIIGGGPAGATLARLIGQKYKNHGMAYTKDTPSNYSKMFG